MSSNRSRFTSVPATGLTGLALMMLALGASDGAYAATTANYQSPLGLNLTPVNYYNPEQPFLNIFKTTGVSPATPGDGWVTHSTMTWDTGEESYLQLDANGYPTTLVSTHQPQQFTSVGVLLVRGLPKSNAGTGLPYRAGQYVVLYDGQGTLNYSFDAALVSTSPGRDVINVTNPTGGGGISLNITSTDPSHTGNYIHNIRVVYAAEESLLAAGNVFRPGFLSLLQKFRALRFVQWLNVDGNGGSLSTWASRPQLTDAGWGSQNGVPLEVAVELCNTTGADCWLNVPHQANNDYITQMATLVHTMLSPSQKVYVEFSNEVWNGTYPQFAYAESQGQAMWPNANVTAFTLNRDWYGMRVAQTCDIWKSVWGSDFSRVHCMLDAQAANTATATMSLQCPLWTGSGNAPCSAHNITDVGISVYFALFQAPVSWTSLPDGGLANIFQEINQGGLIAGDYPGGALAETASWEAAYKAALAPYKLGMVAYEGGQSLVSNNTALANLYVKANRDPRMATAYTTALSNWKANGGTLYNVYADIWAPGQFGEWGALESFLDTVSPLASAPPKWQAIQNFIPTNSCWWAGCVGTIGSTQSSTPMAPSNLTVK
jgi:hypothetical protein